MVGRLPVDDSVEVWGDYTIAELRSESVVLWSRGDGRMPCVKSELTHDEVSSRPVATQCSSLLTAV